MMKNSQKITLTILSVVIVLAVLGYAYICHMSEKPGIDGRDTINGMLKLIVLDKDYVKVGNDRYLFKNGMLDELIKAEYDSYTLNEKLQLGPIETLDTLSIMHVVTVTKSANNYRPVGVSVWSSIFSDKYHSVYFESIDS